MNRTCDTVSPGVGLSLIDRPNTPIQMRWQRFLDAVELSKGSFGAFLLSSCSRLLLDACAAQSFLRVVFLAAPLPPPFFLPPPFGFLSVFGGDSLVGGGAGDGVRLPVCPPVDDAAALVLMAADLMAADSDGGLSFAFLVGGPAESVAVCTKPAAPFKSVVNFGVICWQYFNSFVALIILTACSSSGLNNVWQQAKVSTTL